MLPRRGHGVLRDQFDRASIGVVLCIAEGAGRRAPREKRHYYAMARGSGTECAAILDVLRGRQLLIDEKYFRGRALMLNIVRILSRLSMPPPGEMLSVPPDLPAPDSAASTISNRSDDGSHAQGSEEGGRRVWAPPELERELELHPSP
jgi:four helix bundle protein